MSRSRSRQISTVAFAGVAVVAGALVVPATEASAQAGRGTMSVPRVTTAPPPRASGGPVAAPMRPSTSGRGYLTTPGTLPGVREGAPRRGDLPRIVTEPRWRNGYGYDRGYGRGRGYAYGRNYGVSRYGAGYGRGYSKHIGFGTCAYGCSGFKAGIRIGAFAGSFVLGYPLFVPEVISYYDYVPGEYYDDVDREPSVAESPRAASKLIIVGGGTGGGSDALTVESLGDSVRLSWMANGRRAREVKLFVADSAKRELATRSASPSAPSATFEVATLSAPVAYAGVTVVFMDGVTSTTLVPYRGDAVPGRPR